MKKTILGGAIVATMLMAGAANAQSFTYDITWGEVDQVGGLGPNGNLYRGGSVSGTYTTTIDSGETVTGTVNCVGMNQPPGSMFYFHLACDAVSSEGNTTSLGYGCNFLGEPGPGTPIGCVGGMHGRGGANAGRDGALTLNWYSTTDAHGTGQWYRAAE